MGPGNITEGALPEESIGLEAEAANLEVGATGGQPSQKALLQEKVSLPLGAWLKEQLLSEKEPLSGARLVGEP